mgnify:CR=1 FL=1
MSGRVKRWELSRRAFLGGAGVAVGLPVLEAMLPGILRGAEGQAAPPPVRFLSYYVPNGFHMPDWTPSQAGEGYALPLGRAVQHTGDLFPCRGVVVHDQQRFHEVAR